MINCLGILQLENYVEYSRDSFSHRICDDLCEVILQYLSLEDKIRFECVSHQFQRTVFQRQYELRFDNRYDNFSRNTRNAIDFKSFESVVEKCSNITSVYMENSFFGHRINEFKTYMPNNRQNM